MAFAKAQYDKYLNDVGELSLTLNLDSAHYIEDGEENYRAMAAALDKLWARHAGAG